jgi:PAS domain-containing protein
MVPGKESSDNTASQGGFVSRLQRDPILLAILGMAVLFAFVVLGGMAYWGSGPVLLAVPWYVPLISSFIALTTFCSSYLAFGRYQVLRDPLSFWAGCGFVLYGIGQIFYALSWQGVLPDGTSILGHLTNTSSWVALIDLAILSAFLLAAVLVRWPRQQSLLEKRWLTFVIALGLGATALFGIIILFESSLPKFVTDHGAFTTPMRIWVSIQLGVFAAGSVLSMLRYYRTSDKLAAYIAFPQLALVFISAMVLIDGKRYDLWWYLQRVILVAGHLTVLFGLLREYVRLLQRESEGLRLLEAILENIPIGLTVTGGPPDFPLTRVSRYGLEMNQRPLERLMGITTGQNQADWRIFLPDGVTMPEAEQMPLFRASRLGEEIRNVEFVMEAQDGRQFPVLVNAAPIRDAQGNIVAAVNTWLDITDRKRAEKILQDSEALYRAIAWSIPNGGVFVVDRDLRYLVAEGQVMADFGYTRENLEGRTLSEIYDS